MQTWSRQGECIFCLLCRDVRQQVVPEARRNYHTTSILAQERKRQRFTIRRETFKQGSPRPTDDRQNTKPARDKRWLNERFSKTLIRRPLEGIHDKDQEQAHKTEVEKALKNIQKYYLSNKMDQESSVSQMRELDPDGILWPQFEKWVKDSLDGRQVPSRWLDLRMRLRNIPASYRQTDTERELKFAFLDYVMDQKSPGGDAPYDVRYPTEWYPSARLLQRTIHLHVGPTNSGKTYNALKRLEQAQSGFYAGPLRLLAHEVYSRFNDRGIKCDLITGDDVRLDDTGQAKLYASTVEMVDSQREADVGVIDEIQMLGDADRGWAWTRALLAAKVKELHLCGEARSVPLIREIVASMGDTLHIHQYERLNPLKVMSRSLKGNLQNLRKGDCVVSFSVVNIHALKKQIESDTGKRCAIVYGSLPPETRAQQAALFNDPDNDYDFLVASDAIGMGLNLSIKRIVFETTSKWNGVSYERLSVAQLKQIAGRAGRYRTAQDDKTSKTDVKEPAGMAAKSETTTRAIGLVTCLDEVDLPSVQHALSSDGAPLKAAGILPPGEIFVEFARTLPPDTPLEYVLRRICSTVSTHQRFKICDIRDQLKIARSIDDVEGLPTKSKLVMCAAPANWSVFGSTKISSGKIANAIARIIANERKMTVADIPEIPLEILDAPMTGDRAYLSTLEALHKSLILFLWLSYRFPLYLGDMDMASRAKELCEERINETLLRFSANPKLVQRLKEMQKSSEMLIQQAKESGMRFDTGLIMNPDRTVDEIEAAQRADEAAIADETYLEEKIEVEGELDIGDGEEIQELNETSDGVNVLEDVDSPESSPPAVASSQPADSEVDESRPTQPETSVEEAQRAQNSG